MRHARWDLQVEGGSKRLSPGGVSRRNSATHTWPRHVAAARMRMGAACRKRLQPRRSPLFHKQDILDLAYDPRLMELDEAPIVPRAPAPRRILYVDHTAALSGGEIALLNLIRHLDRAKFTPVVVLFSSGPLVEKLRDSGIETHVLALAASVNNTRKDSLHLSTLLRVKDIVRTAWFMVKLAWLTRALNIDIIHANSLKADVIGGVAGRLAGVKIIWHIRDRIAQDYLPAPVARLFRRLCKVVPHFVVANSFATLSALGGINPGRSAVVNSGSTVSTRLRRYQ